MELKYYSTEQLKSELKRRGEIAKAQKAEELKTALICRNCKHWTPHPQGYNFYCCAVRTCVGRTYITMPSAKACYKFERKED